MSTPKPITPRANTKYELYVSNYSSVPEIEILINPFSNDGETYNSFSMKTRKLRAGSEMIFRRMLTEIDYLTIGSVRISEQILPIKSKIEYQGSTIWVLSYATRDFDPWVAPTTLDPDKYFFNLIIQDNDNFLTALI